MTDTQAELTQRARAALGDASRHWITRNYGRVYLDQVMAEFAQSEREAAVRELQCLRDEKECWRQGYYLACDFIRKQTKQREAAAAEARRAAIEECARWHDKEAQYFEMLAKKDEDWTQQANWHRDAAASERGLASPTPQEATR